MGDIRPDMNLPDPSPQSTRVTALESDACGLRIGLVPHVCYHTKKEVWAQKEVIHKVERYLHAKWGMFYWDCIQYTGCVLQWPGTADSRREKPECLEDRQPGSGATISLVMIVATRARCARETLERVRPIVDEWVIVDTGSTNGTQAIISEYGPVTEMAFEDFVTTKNKALALATGKYILLMDADERLHSGAETLRAVAEAGEWDAVHGESWTGRCLTRSSRNMIGCACGGIRLRGVSAGQGVHEVVTGRAGADARDPGVVVWHDHRHRDGDSFVKRSEWYVELLQAALNVIHGTRGHLLSGAHLQGSRPVVWKRSKSMSYT